MDPTNNEVGDGQEGLGKASLRRLSVSSSGVEEGGKASTKSSTPGSSHQAWMRSSRKVPNPDERG